jgi:hypothetical protein
MDHFECDEAHAHFRDKSLAQKPLEGNPFSGQHKACLNCGRLAFAYTASYTHHAGGIWTVTCRNLHIWRCLGALIDRPGGASLAMPTGVEGLPTQRGCSNCCTWTNSTLLEAHCFHVIDLKKSRNTRVMSLIRVLSDLWHTRCSTFAPTRDPWKKFTYDDQRNNQRRR